MNDVAGRDKPARPPALQGPWSRARANRILIIGSLEGRRSVSPVAGTHATWNLIGGAPASVPSDTNSTREKAPQKLERLRNL